MRNWLILKLGGVPRPIFNRLMSHYRASMTEWAETVETHELQGAWETTKMNRKARRYH